MALKAGYRPAALLWLCASCAGHPGARMVPSDDAAVHPGAQPWPTAAGRQMTRLTTSAITAHDLMLRLSIVADDSMAGRAAGSPGARKTQQYLEAELRRMAIVPAGDAGSYAQAIPMVHRRVSTASTLIASGRSLVLWSDFVPMPWAWLTPPIDGAPVVYGGVLGDTSRSIDPTAVAGKFVILRGFAGRSVFPRFGPGDPLGRAAALAVTGLEGMIPARLNRIREGLNAGVSGNPNLSRSAPASILVTEAAAAALLGRPLDGAAVGAEGPPVRGRIGFADTVLPLCCNVVAVIPGSDPRLSREYVALGAHLDHIGTLPEPIDHDSARAANARLWSLRGRSSAGRADADAAARIHVNVDSLRALRGSRPDSIFNGADDDGSGVVALLEIAESVMAMSVKPRRSLVFVWHTGEEEGNQGSFWFTERPTVPLDSLIAQLNVDMVGRGSREDIARGGPRYLQVIGSRRLARGLGDLIEDVNRARPEPLDLDYEFDQPGDPRALYCRSDHAEYARHGIPIAFFTTGEHPDYHQVTDEVEYIDFPHLATVTGFIQDIAIRLANLSARPILQAPRPDPREPCRP